MSIEPGDCPTEAQLQRVLAALGAKLVPFGSPARATVFAQRDASGEWTLVLGRPGHNEKRKVTLSGGCDERASALGAIIERFARPVLIPTKDPPPPPDAGTLPPIVDAGSPEPVVVDAGVIVEEVVLMPPPPPPPESVDAGPSEPPPPPSLAWYQRIALGAQAGAGLTSVSPSAVAGLWGEVRVNRFSFGASLGYYGPMTFVADPGVIRVDQARLSFFARLKLLTYVGVELGVGLAAALARANGFAVDEEAWTYHAGGSLALLGIFPVGPVELWAALRGWAFINTNEYLIDGVGVVNFPTFSGELTVGVAVHL